MGFKRLDPEDFLVSADSVSQTVWSNETVELSTFFTSSAQRVASLSGEYYLAVNQSETTVAGSTPQFDIAYGDKTSGGGVYFNDAVPGKSTTSTIYGQYRTLVLEDEEAVCKIIDAMLKRFNFRSKFTRDGSETYSEYKNSLKNGTPYDLVILDLTIPGGMGGEDTMKKLLELDPSVKAIVSSGYAVGKILSNYQHYGFKGVLVKPYTITELVEVIQKLL